MAKRGRDVEAELRMFETAWGTFKAGLQNQINEVLSRMDRWGDYMGEEIVRCPLREEYREEYMLRLNNLLEEIERVTKAING